MTDTKNESNVVEKQPKVYGGCEGPDAEYLKLKSSDGHEFIIKKAYARTSGTIAAMLGGPASFRENETNEVTLRMITSHILESVCMYFQYKTQCPNDWQTEVLGFHINPVMGRDLLLAANFLDC